MTIDITSFFFNSSIVGATATAAWGTSVGQNQSKKCRIEDEKPGVSEFLTGMLYKSISDKTRLDISAGSSNREVLLFSKFDKIFINGKHLEDQSFIVLLVRENTESHAGRLIISYPPYALIDETPVNDMAIKEMSSVLGCTENGCWFVHDITVVNQDELHFTAKVVNSEHPMVYHGKSRDRSRAWAELVSETISDDVSVSAQEEVPKHNIQTIIFGSPGSGKSFDIKSKRLVGVPESRIFRTTFHPDFDYASFVGSYKPIKDGDKLTYDFIPQVFTNAYVKAWRNQNLPIYLVIEEINRGNCAQIFGDLFQLLDRADNGESEYTIKAEADLRTYLESDSGLGICHKGIANGELRLPSNFHILATMNTSDQSLFPMDSAFKRRWAWEYVPIKTDDTVDSKDYTITIGSYSKEWHAFLKAVNKKIAKVTESEDKQMGNFFIKGSVKTDEFKSKVMFYLWSEVCKEEYKHNSFFKYLTPDGEKEFSFNDLYADGGDNILPKFIDWVIDSEKDSE